MTEFSSISSVASFRFITALRASRKPRWCCRMPVNASSLEVFSSELCRTHTSLCQSILFFIHM